MQIPIIIDYDFMKDVASEYRQIMDKVELYKNGVVSDQLHQFGLGYEQSYGLSIPIIDEISVSISQNDDLALFCWKQPVRESKLLALRIFNHGLADKSLIDAIIVGITNTELAEQAAYKLFINLEDGFYIVKKLINSSNDYVQYSGLLLLSSIVKRTPEIDDELLIEFLENMIKVQWPDKLYIKRGLASTLLQIGQRNNKLEQKVLFWINNYNFNNQNITNWIEKEVMYFLETKN